LVTEIRVYVEGGGDGAESKAAIRRGFGQFLQPLVERARARDIPWHVVACGSRQATFRDYRTALESHPDAFNVLLVDSESRVEALPWEHLRRQDGWEPPITDHRHCQLMAQVVEAWLVADVETLTSYYGQDFQASALPGHRDVEAVEKQRVFEALDHATRRTQKGKYRKIAHCSELLARLDPERVRARAGHCDRLFRTITELIEETP
jgi:hypothetical protein